MSRRRRGEEEEGRPRQLGCGTKVMSGEASYLGRDEGPIAITPISMRNRGAIETRRWW